MAASIFTLRAIPDLYDHGLTMDSLCGTFQQTFLRLCTHALLFLFSTQMEIAAEEIGGGAGV